jgi:DnaJ-class molecular chaperone
MQDYYAILNIDSNASNECIKKAYRKEASKWHPDKNKSPEATQRMQLINEAYLILSDKEARDRYDQEYQHYRDFKEQSYSNSKQDYSFNDDVLNNWVNNARVQAKEMAKQSLDDLLGMTQAAFKAAYQNTKYHIMLLVILNIIFIMWLSF